MENSQQLLPLLLNQHGMRFNFNDFDDKYLLNNGAQGVISRVRLKSNQQFYIWKRVAYNTNEQQKSADREVDNLIRVQHKYIVKFEGSFVHNQWCYIVMEYCEGGNLRQFIDQLRYKPIKERKNQGINILYQMACALMHFHSLGIVHRDLKPENIFLDKNGNIKTGDFGLSKNLENQSNVSRAGTDTYQPAEAHLLGRMTEKSDIWALGVITTEIITGQNSDETLANIKVGRFIPLPEEIQGDLRKMILAMLNTDPNQRITASEILDSEIMQFLQNINIQKQQIENERNKKEIIIQARTKQYKALRITSLSITAIIFLLILILSFICVFYNHIQGYFEINLLNNQSLFISFHDHMLITNDRRQLVNKIMNDLNITLNVPIKEFDKLNNKCIKLQDKYINYLIQLIKSKENYDIFQLKFDKDPIKGLLQVLMQKDTKTFNILFDNILEKAEQISTEIIAMCVTEIQRMSLSQLKEQNPQTQIDRCLKKIQQSCIINLGFIFDEIKYLKEEQYQYKLQIIASTAKNNLNIAIDKRINEFHNEFIEYINRYSQEVQQKYIDQVRDYISTMTYSQLRNFSANEYANNNLINEAIKLLCSQKLGWLVSKVDQELHTAADSACQKLTQLAQQGFDLSLNGRILYPHSIIEAQQEYGNLTKGLNITLYTYNNQPYNVTCDGNGGVSLTGLYSTTETTHTEVIDSKAQQLISYNNTNNYASFSTSDYTVHVAQRVYMKYWMYKGCGHGPLQKKPRHHNVESQTVKITIPEGWTFGEIKWGKNKDWYKIDGQTITFLAPEISDSALPSVPIKRL